MRKIRGVFSILVLTSLLILGFTKVPEAIETMPSYLTIVLGGKNDVDILRKFRDEVLSNSSQGIEYIKIFYQFLPDAILVLINDPAIRIKTMSQAKQITTMVKSDLEKKTISPQIGEIVDSLLGGFMNSKYISLKLRDEIIRIKKELPIMSFINNFNNNHYSQKGSGVKYNKDGNKYVLVKFKPRVTQSRVSEITNVHRLAVDKYFKDINVYKVRAISDDVAGTINELSKYNEIEYVEPDYVVRIFQTIPNDPYFGSLWGMHNVRDVHTMGGTVDADIDAPEAWDVTTGDSSVVVAVIDTGVDYNHEDLKNNIWTNAGEIPNNNIDDDKNDYIDDYYGWDFCNDDNDPMDDHDHGTHVSGTIGAIGNNSTGVAGVNWNVKIMPLKCFDECGSNLTSSTIEAIIYSKKMGARISSNSWGGPNYSRALYEAIEDFGNSGGIFVAAAGNDGMNNDDTPNYPSNYELSNIIAVAATDRNDNLASWSNYGAASVDIAAPGVDILSTVINDYDLYSGTSMATPHVAGAVALISAKYPLEDMFHIINRVLSGADKKGLLVLTEGRLNIANSLSPNIVFNPLIAGISPKTGIQKGIPFNINGMGFTNQQGEVISRRGSCYTPSSNDLFFDNMESGVENWIHGGTYDSWQISGETWYSSANAWSDSPDGYYTTNTDSYLSINHDIDLSDERDVWIGFWSKVDLEDGYDYLYVQISKDGGDRWQSIGGLTGEDSGWSSHRYMIPEDYLTSQFRFRFNLDTDKSLNCDGVYIDDVGIGIDITRHVIDSENITGWTDNNIALSLDDDYGKNVFIKTFDGKSSNARTISAWQQKQHSNVWRDNAGTAVYDNKIYLFGGYVDGDSATSNAEVYDVVHDKWSNIASMPTKRASVACELNGKIYCVGGGSVEVYDPGNNTYETKNPFSYAISTGRIANLNNTLYFSYCTTLCRYETVSDTWTSLPPMNTARSKHGMVASRGKVYVFGGYDGSSFLRTGEVYNPATNKWSNIADMPIALYGMGAATDGDYIYAIGGSSTGLWSETRSVFLKYDPDIDTWSYVPESLYEILTPKMHSSAALVPNYGIFSVNGYDGDNSLNELEFLKINWTLIANSRNVTTRWNTPIKITLTGSSSVNNPITWTILSDPSHGSLTGTTPNLTYTPNGCYAGLDSFDFEARGEYGGVDTATVNIAVIDPSLPGNVDITSPGSADRVDGYDLYVLSKAFGATSQDPDWNLVCDLNDDLTVDGDDLVLLAANFGKKKK